MVVLTLQISNITGNSFTIKCDDQLCIKDLKQIISNRFNDLEPYLLRLLYDKVELSNDEQFINQTPIRNGDKLFYLIKLNPEIEILLEIKKKMNLGLNWSKDVDLSEWERIEIDNDNCSKFKVRKLYLASLQLIGEIPKDIGKLTNLQFLYLFNNQLTGEIPKEFGKLTNLQKLYLNNNQLTGEIPKEIGKLTNLQYLKLSNNQLIGEIPKDIGSNIIKTK